MSRLPRNRGSASAALFPLAVVAVSAVGATTLLAHLSVAAVSVDEPGYLAAGADYVGADYVLGPTSLNLEHPYLAKQLIGLSLALSSQARFGDSLLAGRLPGVACAALTAVVVFAVGREIAGRWAGLVAAGLWLGLPQSPGTLVLRVDRYSSVGTDEFRDPRKSLSVKPHRCISIGASLSVERREIADEEAAPCPPLTWIPPLAR